MKKLYTLLAIALVVMCSSCSKFDDSAIWDKLNEQKQTLIEHEKRIAALEELCKQMNTNISSLQTIVNALQQNDYITSVIPINQNGTIIGYTIAFAKSGAITIYHGTDGKDGADGTNGKDGKDGYTPQIGVKKDSDGIYYWTLDGEWLTDANGNKIKAVGTDGKDGQDGKPGADGENGQDGKDGADGQDGKDGADGKDGITPQLKIEDDYWYVSYDNGQTWIQLGKATGADGEDGADGSDGADGANGKDGDSIFSSVTQDDEFVYFYLSDGTMITLPKHDKENIQFEDLNVKAICCQNWDTNYDGELSYDEAAAVTSIGDVFYKNTNIISFAELKYFTGITSLSAKAFSGCVNLWKIIIPDNVTNFGDGNAVNVSSSDIASSGDYYGTFLGTRIENIALPQKFTTIGCGAFYGSKLKRISMNPHLVAIKKSAFRYCIYLTNVNLPEGLQTIERNAFENCDQVTSITVPASVATIERDAFNNCDLLTHIYCKPTTPPTCDGEDYGPLGYNNISGTIIYVPVESVSAYKTAGGWENHKSLIYGYNFGE